VRHKALVIAYGVHASSSREMIGLDVGEAETEAFWREFLRSLRARAWTGSGCVSPTLTPASRPRSRRCWAARGSVHLCRLPGGGRVPPATFTAGRGPWQRDLRGPACRPVPPSGGGLGTGQWESCCEHQDERPAERARRVAALDQGGRSCRQCCTPGSKSSSGLTGAPVTTSCVRSTPPAACSSVAIQQTRRASTHFPLTSTTRTDRRQEVHGEGDGRVRCSPTGTCA
jgi:Transposase, Mutator family